MRLYTKLRIVKYYGWISLEEGVQEDNRDRWEIKMIAYEVGEVKKFNYVCPT